MFISIALEWTVKTLNLIDRPNNATSALNAEYKKLDLIKFISHYCKIVKSLLFLSLSDILATFPYKYVEKYLYSIKFHYDQTITHACNLLQTMAYKCVH